MRLYPEAGRLKELLRCCCALATNEGFQPDVAANQFLSQNFFRLSS
jgi:hypothetical protein